MLGMEVPVVYPSYEFEHYASWRRVEPNRRVEPIRFIQARVMGNDLWAEHVEGETDGETLEWILEVK